MGFLVIMVLVWGLWIALVCFNIRYGVLRYFG